MIIQRLKIAGLAFWLAASTTAYGAQDSTPIQDSTYQDWSAHALELALADGSILTDYAASSLSSSLSDNRIVISYARIVISFVPRFNCVPLISVVVANYFTSGDVLPQFVSLELDGRELPFPAIVDTEDTEETVFRYSYNASVDDQSKLLELLDNGSQLNVLFSARQSASADITAAAVAPDLKVSFSLLGSRKSALAARGTCKAHEPVPFESNQ